MCPDDSTADYGHSVTRFIDRLKHEDADAAGQIWQRYFERLLPLARDWMDSPDPVRRRCGYALLYERSKKYVARMDDDYLIGRIDHIEAAIHGEDMWVRESMNTALMGIGKRNKTLNRAAVRAAKTIGPVDIDYGDDNRCEPLDVLKHLTSDRLQKKLAR